MKHFMNTKWSLRLSRSEKTLLNGQITDTYACFTKTWVTHWLFLWCCRAFNITTSCDLKEESWVDGLRAWGLGPTGHTKYINIPNTNLCLGINSTSPLHCRQNTQNVCSVWPSKGSLVHVPATLHSQISPRLILDTGDIRWKAGSMVLAVQCDRTAE